MAEDFPATMYGVAVKRAPLGANRSDANVLPKTIAIIHDIEGGASGALGKFASPGVEGGDQGSTTFVADPDGKAIWQLMGADSAVAYGCGNYDFNRRAIQIELPGVAGTPYDAEVLDYAARFLAWCNYTHGIPLTKLSLAALNGGALAGVCGHEDIPNPNNPSHGGGEDEHHDPGPTFPWDKVLISARVYAGSPPLIGGGTGADSGHGGGGSGGGQGSSGAGRIWPTGFRIGGDFWGTWSTLGGHQRDSATLDVAAAIALFGYPVSRVYVDEQPTPHIVVQWFERARMEKHPDGTITLGLIGSEMFLTIKKFLPLVASRREG